MTAVPAAIAARRGQEKDVDAFGRVFREHATDPQRFVIGMGEDGHQPRSAHEGAYYRSEMTSASSRLTNIRCCC